MSDHGKCYEDKLSREGDEGREFSILSRVVGVDYILR